MFPPGHFHMAWSLGGSRNALRACCLIILTLCYSPVVRNFSGSR